ncbi:hypothetical protein [Pseudokineococcus lusitanus]|uniref:Uncharacterized protein n=1 Tax=Pseudokineococcus lusitanus TaxID=763993 RepID=A0A3N1HTR8_9ACTN|nr:hypothetical protein [Pseudokineococcus lusitanus]ROP45924.1 hypothetical protein EDC03_0539 [Pseudokineococcus lusitanus]
MSRSRHVRKRKVGDPVPTCPAGCGARVLVVRDEAGQEVLVDFHRAPDERPTVAALAVRRTGPMSGLARSVDREGARPLEPNERLHRVHAQVCPRNEGYAHRERLRRAQQGSAAAADVVDVTVPRWGDE